MDRRDPRLRSLQPGGDIGEAYGGRIDQLMLRLERLRRRLHDPARTSGGQEALRSRMAWLHGAIFAISAELDCGY